MRLPPRRIAMVAVCLTVACVSAACQPPPPLGTISTQAPGLPQWPVVADPSVLAENGHYYVFGTAVDGLRMPVHVVDALDQGAAEVGEWLDSSVEALPVAPAWTVDNLLTYWAPTVARAADGTYVAFFAAQRANPPTPGLPMCVGRATATSPEGPYVADKTPFTCGLGGKTGAIDPALFHAPDGSWYLYAAFTGTAGSIYGYQLDAHLDQVRDTAGLGCCRYDYPVYLPGQKWEGTWIENPSMTYDADSNTYLLAYSAGVWSSADYSTGLARCSTPLGFCTPSQSGPWLTKNAARTGTGGLSFFTDADGSTKLAFSSFPAGREDASPRDTTAAALSYGTEDPTLQPIYEPSAAVEDQRAHEGSGRSGCVVGRDVTQCLDPGLRSNGK